MRSSLRARARSTLVVARASCRSRRRCWARRAVDSVDIDPMAVRATEENAARNGVREIVRVAKGSLGEAWPFAEPPSGRYDIVLANLNSRLVQSMATELIDALAPGGMLIASGVIEEQEPACRQAIEAGGGRVDDVSRRDGWVAFVVRRAR